MINRLLLLIVLSFFTAHAQQQKEVKAGVITLASDQMLGFSNLKIVEDNVSFINIATNTEVTHPLSEVRLIEDDNQKTIYKGNIAPNPKPVTIINDTLYRPNYPEGIYKTKEDFLKKKPSSREFVLPVDRTGTFLQDIEHNCFFLVDDGDKLKNAFAVSYKGNLYFQVNAVLKNRNKTDRAQTYEVSHEFIRVILGGDNYFYTETGLANVWAQAASYGVAGGVAGAMGGGSASVPGDPWRYSKGIVWDFKNKEFNIFKNCKDYNKFIEPIYPEGVQECDGQQPEIYLVREAMEKVK